MVLLKMKLLSWPRIRLLLQLILDEFLKCLFLVFFLGDRKSLIRGLRL